MADGREEGRGSRGQRGGGDAETEECSGAGERGGKGAIERDRRKSLERETRERTRKPRKDGDRVVKRSDGRIVGSSQGRRTEGARRCARNGKPERGAQPQKDGTLGRNALRQWGEDSQTYEIKCPREESGAHDYVTHLKPTQPNLQTRKLPGQPCLL